MTHNNRRIDLHELQTMEQVRHERLRLNYALRHSEHLLERDLERVGEVCRPQYWINIFSRQAADLVETITGTISARVRRLASGWGIADRIFSGLLGRIFRPREEVWIEEDIILVPDEGPKVERPAVRKPAVKKTAVKKPAVKTPPRKPHSR